MREPAERYGVYSNEASKETPSVIATIESYHCPLKVAHDVSHMRTVVGTLTPGCGRKK